MRKDHDGTAEPIGPALIVTYGNTTRRQRALDRDVFVLGRSPGCDLVLVAPEVAPVHCVLLRTATGWRVRDCSGRAGTQLNGQPVQEGPLDDDDLLQVGTFTFRLRLPAESPPVAPPQQWTNEEHRAEDEALTARLAEAEQQAEALRKGHAELEDRTRQIDADERELSERRTALERDEEELQRLRARIEREVVRRREEAEAKAKAIEEEARRREAELIHAARTPSVADDALQLDRRRAELERFARHLRRQFERLKQAAEQAAAQAAEEMAEQAAELARLRDEIEALRHEAAGRPDTVADMPSPVRAAEMMNPTAEQEARAESALFQGELAALAVDLGDAQARLREEASRTVALRKQADIALGNEEELRRRLERLEREVRERETLIEKLQARNQANPWDTQALSTVEMELNRFRLELDRDRREMEEDLRRLRQGQEDLQQVRRESELEMSRERAQLARDRVELNRMRDEMRREQERLAREAGSRGRLAPRRFKEELMDQRRGEAGA